MTLHINWEITTSTLLSKFDLTIIDHVMKGSYTKNYATPSTKHEITNRDSMFEYKTYIF